MCDYPSLDITVVGYYKETTYIWLLKCVTSMPPAAISIDSQSSFPLRES